MLNQIYQIKDKVKLNHYGVPCVGQIQAAAEPIVSNVIQSLRIMAKVLTLLKTIRNNWKKSVVGAAALSYGISYGRQAYE